MSDCGYQVKKIIFSLLLPLRKLSTTWGHRLGKTIPSLQTHFLELEELSRYIKAVNYICMVHDLWKLMYNNYFRPVNHYTSNVKLSFYPSIILVYHLQYGILKLCNLMMTDSSATNPWLYILQTYVIIIPDWFG